MTVGYRMPARQVKDKFLRGDRDNFNPACVLEVGQVHYAC